MPILPILLLILLAVAAWLVRNRPERVVWGVSVVGQLTVWTSLLALRGLVPTSVQISVWQPSGLFVSPISLQLDAVGWTISFAISTLLLAISLTSVARAGSATPATRTFMCVFGALGMAAAMAGNLLTVAVTWALIDVVAFASHLVLVRRPEMVSEEITRLGVGGMSIVCILASASLALIPTGNGSGASVPAGIAVLAGGLLRIGLYPAHYQLPTLPGVRRGLGTLLRLVPVGVGLALIARRLTPAFVAVLGPGLVWLGGLTALVAAALWALHIDAVERRPMFVLGFTGLSLAAAGLHPGEATELVVGGAVTVILVGGMISLAVLHEAWHRWWVILAGIMVLGAPGMPAQSILAAFAIGLLNPGSVAPTLLGCLALVGVTAGIGRLSFESPQKWLSAEDLVRFAYAAGIGLPFLAAVVIERRLAPAEGWGFLGLMVILGSLSALAVFGLSRAVLGQPRGLWSSFGMWRIPSPGVWLGRAAGIAMNALTWASALIEGEAALLWVLFLLLALAAILGVGK